jgi:hypothetical protein
LSVAGESGRGEIRFRHAPIGCNSRRIACLVVHEDSTAEQHGDREAKHEEEYLRPAQNFLVPCEWHRCRVRHHGILLSGTNLR